MSSVVAAGPSLMSTYTWDVFCTLDGFGSYDEDGDWGGFWGKQGPEFLDRRLEAYDRRAADGARAPTPSGSS